MFFFPTRFLIGALSLALASALALAAAPLRADGVTLTLTIEGQRALPTPEAIQRRADAALPDDLHPVLRHIAREGVAAALDRPLAQSLTAGEGNRAHVIQRGDGHSALLAQPGRGQRALLVQNGRGAEAVIRQPEDVPLVLSFQHGFGRKR